MPFRLFVSLKNVQKRTAAEGLYSREMQYIPDFLRTTNNELLAYETDAGSTRTIFGYGHQRLSQTTPSGQTFFHSDLYGSPLYLNHSSLHIQIRIPHQALVHFPRALPALADRLHHKRLPRMHVARRKYAVHAGLKSARLRLYIRPAVRSD